MTKKKIYGLRTRNTDKDKWSEAQYFQSEKARNEAAAFNRIIGGIRTHSFDEKVTQEELDTLELIA